MTEQTLKSDVQATEEHRAYNRLPRTFSVSVKELNFAMARSHSIEGQCADISQGGICIESPVPIQLGAKMHVRVRIPLLNRYSPGFLKIYENDADQYFTAITETMWSKPVDGSYLIGMRFVNADENQARALAGMINKAMDDSLKA